ncbi:MAG: hypothetical protein JEY99_18985 [Spirochaetales bacterium]|nr:hypothetical protein [Spirochaetales bacterium]
MKKKLQQPLAITMWDFSWLERRWPGAGFEDWIQCLDELKDRGYDAIRIEAYPHLLSAAPDSEWVLLPVWNQQDWGSPAKIRVNIKNNLLEFLSLCRDRGILVALSTWFREDNENTRMNIKNPQQHGQIWVDTLNIISKAGLLDTIFYVDLCNEFSISCWTPFLPAALGKDRIFRKSEEGTEWMKSSIEHVRRHFPDLDYCFSVCDEYDTLFQQDTTFLDLFEPHIWMAQSSEFYNLVGYNYERFDSIGYENLVEKGEKIYRLNPEYWKKVLGNAIQKISSWSEQSGKPLITTECWGVVDYKDWPGLNWNWVKELCEFGTIEASRTGRWISIATSNFCAPQFRGMWNDINWHKRLTDIIHQGKLPEFNSNK